MISGIFELAVVVLMAAGLGIAAKFLRQPLILAYLATGILIGLLGFFNVANRETFRVFSDLGIMFLLFLVGLEINYTSLRLVGKIALIVGVGQIIFTSVLGFLLASFFGFGYGQSVFIGLALTFSSTIVVVKLLTEKKDLHSLYGKISVGILLLQDFIAILVLTFLTGIKNGANPTVFKTFFTFGEGLLLFGLMLWLGRKIMPRLFDLIGRSQELLFLISLAWVFFMAATVYRLGFSIEIGGFLAGLALANSSENFEIASRIRPLRDFFILIFFVILGSSLVFSNFHGLLLPILGFSLFVLIGDPLIVLILMSMLGYRRRISFLTGVTMAQISEFSLVLAALAFKVGYVSEKAVAVITATGVITIIFSSYLVIYADYIFRYLSPFLKVFERRTKRLEGITAGEIIRPVILIGFHRIGQSVAMTIPSDQLLIIDFDPLVINRLRRLSFAYLFGDVADPEIFEEAHFGSARTVICTSPDFEDNLSLLKELKKIGHHPKTIVRAEDENDALILYKEGADYVLLPHLTSGQYLGEIITVDPELKNLRGIKTRDLKSIAHRQLM